MRTGIKIDSKWWAYGVVLTGTFMGGLNTYIVNVSLPAIATALEADIAVVQWVLLAYLLAITSSLVIFGRASDLWGSRRVFTAGLLTFVLGSALAGAAPTAWSLVAFRGIQGLGSAMMTASGQALLAEVFPEDQRGRALASMHVAVALGFATGASMGGLLVEALGWRWVFFANLPAGILAALAAAWQLPEVRRARERGSDPAGTALLVVGLVLTLLGLTEVQQSDFRIGSAMLVAGVAVLAAFALVEYRAPHPVLDLRLFRHLGFTAGLLAAFFNFIAMASNMFLIPFFLQLQLGMNPVRAGLVMMAVPLAILWSAPIGGWCSDRLGPRMPATAGLTLVTATVFLMALLGGNASALAMALVLTIYGVGAGLFQSPNNSGVLGSAPRERLGTASGTLATMRQLGQVAGIALASTVWVLREQGYLAAGAVEITAQGAGFRDAFLVLGIAGVLAIAASAVRGGKLTMAGRQAVSSDAVVASKE
ncbi:MAG: MFS transporter [Dehalococcoidia bacterium]